MDKYAILIYDDPTGYETLSPEEWQATIDAHGKFVESVFALGGSLAGGEALAATRTATSVRGGGTVTDGPFLETKEALERAARGEPLWRVHECVFAVLALESEPVDPRL